MRCGRLSATPSIDEKSTRSSFRLDSSLVLASCETWTALKIRCEDAAMSPDPKSAKIAMPTASCGARAPFAPVRLSAECRVTSRAAAASMTPA